MSENNAAANLKKESYKFLLEDYKQAREMYKQLNKRITTNVVFVYIYFAVMLFFLAYLLNSNFFTIIAFSISASGILISIRTIRVFLNMQKERCYLESRLENIRGLFLVPEKSDAKMSQYLLTDQKIAIASEESIGRDSDNRRETYYNIMVMLGFLSIWTTVSIFIIYRSWIGVETFGGIIFAGKVFPLLAVFIFFLVKGIFYRMHKQEFSLPRKSTDQ
ncbi:MAG: hypothetical protein PVH61_34980 [Candidatus Aminicenantes bacterium]|jgi:hypothetical protein